MAQSRPCQVADKVAARPIALASQVLAVALVDAECCLLVPRAQREDQPFGWPRWHAPFSLGEELISRLIAYEWVKLLAFYTAAPDRPTPRDFTAFNKGSEPSSCIISK